MSEPGGTWKTVGSASGEVLDRPTAPDTAMPRDDAPIERDRYDPGGLLGRGGMGEVRIARDLRLGRDVALKTARPDAPDAARLLREAAMTARLEHPSIMPVYDAGRGADGLVYYTMRLLPGRSLAEALRLAPRGPDRLRLVRHLVDAAEAIAYAHGRGVLHRDLKPANIMVGAFGETVVADWGLACTLAEAARPRAGGAGSPGYMSPEQAQGAPLDGRTDVYGLGAVLYELLVGEPPTAPDSGPPLTARAAAPDAPPALAAIADRALRPDPADRYPSARAFADDLLAWYEGRRVSAHAYTLREVLARIAATWRVPLLVAAVGVVALSAAVGVGWWRTAVERERAVASEADAVAARLAEGDALARALVAQARAAAEDGRAREAEILAVNALLRGPSAAARGVLARFAVSPRVAQVALGAPLPGCRRHALSSTADRLVCLTHDRAFLLDPLRPDPPLAEVPGAFEVAGFATEARVVLAGVDGRVWDWSPPAVPVAIPGLDLPRADFIAGAVPGRVTVIKGGTDWALDPDAGTLTPRQTCGFRISPNDAVVAPGGDVVAACSDMRIVRRHAGEPARTVYTVGPDDGTPFRVHPLADGRIVVGTVKGWVLVLAPTGEVLARRNFGDDAVRLLASDGDRLALARVGGVVTVWNPVRDEVLATLHVRANLVAWRPDGVLRLVSDRVEDRRVPARPDAHRIGVPGGVAGLDLSPDGTRAAVGTGDGSVLVVDVAAARVERAWRWQDRVAKDVAWSPDGRLLAAATAGGDEQRVLDPGSGATVAMLAGETARRVAWLPRGLFIGTYREDLRWWPVPGQGAPERIAAFQAVEIEHDADGAVVILEVGLQLYRADAATPSRLRPIRRLDRAHSVAPLGEHTLVADDAAVLEIDAAGGVVRQFPVESAVIDIAVSLDRRLLAFAHIDGHVTIWRVGDDTPLATLEGHTARVAAVAFSRDGRRVVTGGWDATVRVWSTVELEMPADELARRIEAEWGSDLDAVLGGPP